MTYTLSSNCKAPTSSVLYSFFPWEVGQCPAASLGESTMKPSPSQPEGNQSGLCQAREGLDSCYKMGKNCGRYHIGHSRLHIENIVFQCQNIELFTGPWSNIKLGLVNNLYPTAKTKEGQEGFSLSEERSGVSGAWGAGGTCRQRLYNQGQTYISQIYWGWLGLPT